MLFFLLQIHEDGSYSIEKIPVPEHADRRTVVSNKLSEIWHILKEETKMNASVAIQVLPNVQDDEEVIRIVDEVIAYIKSTGLNYYVGPFETTIEGDYDQLMDIVKECQHVAERAGCKAMSVYVKISYKPEGDVLTIEKKVTKHHQ